MNNDCQSARGRTITNDDRRSWRSSAVSGSGRGLVVHLRHGRRIERSDRAEVDREPAPQRDRVGAAVLELFVVEEGVGPRGEDLMRQHRRLGGVGEVHGDGARFHPLEQRAGAVDVEGLVQGVVDGLAHEHVIGDLDRPGGVLLAGGGLGEHRGHQVVGLHALDRRRVAPPVAEAQHHERAVEVPTPPGLEHRRVEDGVLERVVDGRAAEVAGHLVQREAVVRAEGEHDGVVARRGLQLEVEGAAELLAQREPERTVDATTEGRVHHQLHPAGLVEEAFEHELLLGGHGAEHRPADREVVDDHRGRVGVDAGRGHQPLAGPVGIAGGEEPVDRRPQVGHLGRQLGGAGRGLAHPERDRRRRGAGVAHADHAHLDLADLPRMRAEQEDVARHRLDGPVFVDGADERVVGFGDDAIVAGLGDGPARRDRGEARALAPAQLAVDRVVVHVRAACAAPGGDAVADEVDHLVELVARHLGVGRGAPEEREEIVGAPLLRAHLGHDLLRGDVEREVGELDGVEAPGANRGEERGALDQLVARERVQPPLGGAGAAVVGTAHPLQERGDAARRADLAHQLDRADVDAELQRRGGDQRPQVAGAQAGLHPVAAFLRQAAVVRGDDVVAEAGAELVREPFGEPPGVDEHERGAVLPDQRGDAIEDVAHLLGRRDCFELAVGEFQREVEVALVTGVDDHRQLAIADEQPADGFDRPLRGRQPDPVRDGCRTAPRAVRG